MTEVCIVAGVGGAGKTTTAAALGVAHARAGRRVVVLTIDPARRLADALGLAHLGNTPQAIDLDLPEGARLDALMLDRKATWDDVIQRHAGTPELAARLLANPYYAALSTRLTGGHEYMATEKLHALATDGTWDLVIVDTPPSQHALDFFRAPERIQRILDQRLIGALLGRGGGLLGLATRQVVGVVRRLAGDKVLADLTEFFGLVSELSEGFRTRGAEVQDLLRADSTRYLLVANAAAPRADDLLEFLAALREGHQRFEGFVLNRVLDPLPATPDAVEAALQRPDGDLGVAVDRVLATLRTRARDATRHEHLAKLLRERSGAPVWRVPDVGGGIADLSGLVDLATHLPPNA